MESMTRSEDRVLCGGRLWVEFKASWPAEAGCGCYMMWRKVGKRRLISHESNRDLGEQQRVKREESGHKHRKRD